MSEDVTIINRAQLQPQSYTPVELAVEMQNQMNAVTMFTGSPYTCTFNPSTHQISVALSYQHPLAAFSNYPGFYLVDEPLMQTAGFQSFFADKTKSGIGLTPYTINWFQPQSCFNVIGLQKGHSYLRDWGWLEQDLAGSPPYLLTHHTTGTVDVRSVEFLYLHCEELSDYRVLGPSGSRSILARAPVHSLFGGVASHTHSGSIWDSVPCGGRQLSTLTFSLRDSNNNPIDLHGGCLSFTLLFVRKPSM